MFNYTREILKSLHLFPSHYLLPQTTKIDVINLGIRRCAPIPGHHTPYQQSRSGRRVFAKLSNMARSITTKISFQRCITPKQLLPNFNNLQIIPTEHRVQSSTSNNKAHLSLVNTRSLPSKGEELKYYITEKAIDICAITESWIHKDATDAVMQSHQNLIKMVIKVVE